MHGSPSEQDTPSFAGVNTHPTAGSHESAVHELMSSQTRGVPVHCPSTQASFTVQAFPSSHGAVMGVNTHVPVFLSQESSVHGLPSSQTSGTPTHCPPEQ